MLDARLGEMVVCAWSSRVGADADASHPVMPDGCIDLLFESATGRLEVVGTMTKTLWVTGCGPTEHVGIRFRPGGASPLLRIDAAELTDVCVPAEDLLGLAARDLETRLVEAEPGARTRLLESFLLRRIVRVDPRIVYAAERLRAGPSTRVDAIARDLGISRQYTRRLFLKHTGLTPKAFASVTRLARLWPGLDRAVPLARVAFEAGYADHAHMTREVRRLTGATPSAFSRRVPSVRDNREPAP